MNTTTVEQVRGRLPVKELTESPLNPRRTFSEQSLRELADSMGSVGQLSPLAVRPIGTDPKFAKGKWSGVDRWEVVCGHRRLRAARLGGIPELDVVVRLLDDDAARACMLVENAQREDVSPSEQAAAVGELVAAVGQEEAARQVGWPLSRVRDLMRLATLPTWFLAAVDAGEVSLSAAAIVGRIPSEANRTIAAVCVLLGEWEPHRVTAEDLKLCESGKAAEDRLDRGDVVLSVKDTKELVKKFQRELKGQPWRKALDLVPGVPPCADCPKLAGNAAKTDDSYADTRADTCLDPTCFEAKQAAWGRLTIAKAEKKGRTVIPAEKAAELFSKYDPSRLAHGSGYLTPDTVCWEDKAGDEPRTYGELLKGHLEPVVAIGPDGKAHDLFPADAAKKALKELHGIGARVGSGGGGHDYKREQALARKKQEDAKAAAGMALGQVAGRMASAMEGRDYLPLLRQVLAVVADMAGADACRLVGKRRGLEYDPNNVRDCVEQCALSTATDEVELVALAAELAAAKRAAYWQHSYGGNFMSKEEKAFWDAFGVDKAALLRAAAGERKEKEQAKGKGKKAKAPTGAKAKKVEPVRFTKPCRVCGCTDDDCRQCIEKTGEPCSWVEADLCSACVGADVRTPPIDEPTPGPLVCKPVGEGLLRDVPGVTAADAAKLETNGLRTLADLEARIRERLSALARQIDSLNTQIYTVLGVKAGGPLLGDDADRLANAIDKHLNAATPAELPTPAKPAKAKTKPTSKAKS